MEVTRKISSFFTTPNVLTATECQQIINYCTDKCKPSTLGVSKTKVGNAQDFRHSVNTFLRPEDIKELPVIRKLTDCIVKSSLECYNFSLGYIEPVQYAEYTEGMFYKPHIDSGETFDYDRDISVSVFLSPKDDYEGGNLCFLYPSGWIEADEQQGSMVIFPSMLTHKVEKVKKGKRSSLVLWCKR